MWETKPKRPRHLLDGHDVEPGERDQKVAFSRRFPCVKTESPWPTLYRRTGIYFAKKTRTCASFCNKWTLHLATVKGATKTPEHEKRWFFGLKWIFSSRFAPFRHSFHQKLRDITYTFHMVQDNILLKNVKNFRILGNFFWNFEKKIRPCEKQNPSGHATSWTVMALPLHKTKKWPFRGVFPV